MCYNIQHERGLNMTDEEFKKSKNELNKLKVQIEEQIKVINHRIDDLERKVG